MGKYKITTLLLWAFFVSCIKLELKVEAKPLSLSEDQIEAKLKLLNKPAVKTIKSKNGEIIDCVDIYKQPAFDHPALKNHTIQMIPLSLSESQNSRPIHASQENNEVFQTWHKSGSCPKGTVPIRRILKEDLLRTTSPDYFGMKFPDVLPDRHAVASLGTSGENFKGAQGDINVWNPRIDLSDDYTTAQIWLKTYNDDGDFESMEAGWMVNPKLYGNSDTHLFSYWTKDSYKSTGCFDLTCSGFVQTSNTIALGYAISTISIINDIQYTLNFQISLDGSGNWYLKVRNDTIIGYWPSELFDVMKNDAKIVQWGGQVFSLGVSQSPHTKTEMGSGAFADAGNKYACYITNMRVMDSSNVLKFPGLVEIGSKEPHCYSILKDDKYEDPALFFGGPGGKSSTCP